MRKTKQQPIRKQSAGHYEPIIELDAGFVEKRWGKKTRPPNPALECDATSAVVLHSFAPAGCGAVYLFQLLNHEKGKTTGRQDKRLSGPT